MTILLFILNTAWSREISVELRQPLTCAEISKKSTPLKIYVNCSDVDGKFVSRYWELSYDAPKGISKAIARLEKDPAVVEVKLKK